MLARRWIQILSLHAAIFAACSVFAADGSVTAQSAVDRWKAEPATIFDSSEVSLDDFRWLARPVIVFADTPANPAFKRQVDLLEARVDELVKRDVVLIIDTSRADPSDVRRKLRPRGFMLTLIGKDGGVKLRKPFPWDVRELSRSIDKIPLRQQEIRDAVHSAE
ncbi:MAG: DUF4174 domain-containing protein [Boseongicola sp.]